MDPDYVQTNAVLLALVGLSIQLSPSLRSGLGLGNLGFLLAVMALVLGVASIQYY